MNSLARLTCLLAITPFLYPATTLVGQDGPTPPQVAEASSQGADAIAQFKRPEGWSVDLVAAEPNVANIVAFDLDRHGRLWVCETFRQDQGVTDNRSHDEQWVMADLAAQSVEDRHAYFTRLLGEQAITYTQQDDRVRLLQDTDGDGTFDQASEFAAGFNQLTSGTGAGVLAIGNDVYYACIPDLWLLRDDNGDGKSDHRKSLADGFGVRVAFRGHDMHGLIRGPDGRIYFSIGDRGYNVQTDDGRHLFDPASGAVFRCELDGSGLEVVATGLRNPQELAFDDYGNWFTGDNNSDSGDQARWVYIARGGDSGWRMSYQYLPDRGPFNREKIWHPFHQEQPAYIVPPICNLADGPSGLAYYPGTGLGDDWKGRFLLADFRGTPSNSGIRTFRVEPQGAFYNVVDQQQPIWSILATDVALGPDGNVYVSDWVDGWVGQGKGRIYRFAPKNRDDQAIVDEVKTLLSGDFTKLDADRLQQLMGHADQRVRLHAQWELADRAEPQPFVATYQNPELSRVHRLHAVWGMGQLARAGKMPSKLIATVEPLVDDGDPYLRAAGLELLGSLPEYKPTDALRAALDDPNARVQYYAAMALSDLRDAGSIDAVIKMLDRTDNQDPVLRHGAVMALANSATSDKLASFVNHPSDAVRRAVVVALRRQSSPRVAEFLGDEQISVALEAARAINDAPINDALQPLAALISKKNDSDALMRRVLNANFRLGGSANLNAVAAYAADADASKSLRLDAIEMLDQWTHPDPRDRVMNLWRPLAPRLQADVAGAVQRHLSDLLAADDAIANRSIELAAKLNLKQIAPQMRARLDNASLDPAARASAMLAIAKLDPRSAATVAVHYRNDPEPQLQIAAIKTLAQLNDAGLIDALVDAIDADSVAVQQTAWDLLAADKSERATSVIADSVRDYIDGRLPPELWLNVLQAAQGRLPDTLASQLADADAAWAKDDPAAEYRYALAGGDVKTGEKLFMEKTELSCVRCHRVHRRGGDVGPVLTTIGAQRDTKYLLESIVRPDAAIAKGFETAVIADETGNVYTGIVRGQDDHNVRLVQADGKEVSIPADEIVARRRGKSAMPEDLVKQMSPRDIRDLVAYLSSLKIDPRAKGKDDIE